MKIAYSPAVSPKTVTYRTLSVDSVNIAYREAGDPANPKLVLLHGFPSSSHQYRNLIPALADQFHVIAPDYPGFGNSDVPDPAEFSYTFDHLAEVTAHFLEQKDFTRSPPQIPQQEPVGPFGDGAQASMIRAYYLLVLTVSAERIELALFRQGSGSARKKFRSTFLRKRAFPSRSHSGNSGRSAFLTCLWSVCFAQSNTMPVSFFASSGQKTDSIALFNRSVRRLGSS